MRVQAPDGSIVEFPDDTPQDTIRDAMRRKYGGPAAGTASAPSAPAAIETPGFRALPVTETPDGQFVVTPAQQAPDQAPSALGDVARSVASGVARGVVGMPGIPGNLEWLIRRGAQGVQQTGWGTAPTGEPETLAGAPQTPQAPLPPIETIFPTSEDVISGFEGAVAPITHTPKTRAGRFARAIGEFAPAALFPTRAVGLPAQIGTRVGSNVVAPAVASEGLGQALEGTSGETAGRVAGALLGPYVPRATLRAVTPLPADPLRRAATDVMDAEQVPLTAGQRTGRRSLQFAESAATEMPFAGRRIADTLQDQGIAFTQAAMRRVDEAGGTIQPGVVADPAWIRGARARIGGQFDALTANHDIVFTGRAGQARGRALQAEALRLEAEYNHLVPPELQRNPHVHNLVDDVANAIAQGRIDGAQYQSWRSDFSRMAAQNRADPEFQRFIAGMREALDDAMESGIPAAAQAAWQQARREWRHLLVLEDAVASAGTETALGIVSPQALARAAKSGDRSGYARGIVPFSDIAHAGSAAMERLPNSGTPGRLAAMYGIPTAIASGLGTLGDIATGAPGAFSGAGLAGLAMPPLWSRAITSGPVQWWLGNQGAAGPLAATGATHPGMVGRALLLPWQQPDLLGERPPRNGTFRPVAEALGLGGN